MITRAPAFMANDYLGTWYSKNGLVCLNIDDLTLKSVTFTFSQASDSEGTRFQKLLILQRLLEMRRSWTLQIPGEIR